ncbi:NADH-quinone oxidoreductase subunit A [Bowmanella dokdonensis]|uniref:NADH-quinone oxidoreductase subunit n=1 Tax=Bowmanella dokdonensis TaxID=751969 RepID=A0A939IMY3_9ALTE|nr:NADH-quinone oxidoreductase subunit A [Bowmanella dokdonensis]MBN7824280.1 NADH-quinone oxidoreductase subunit A [Bowmanella dokdonensis]
MDLANLLLIPLIAAVLILALEKCLRRNHSSYPQARPYSGGGDLSSHAWCRFHVRYYPMALLLIAFEMEMMFMYPWAVVYVAEGIKALMEMGMFLTILALGIVYAWREGVFRWQ